MISLAKVNYEQVLSEPYNRTTVLTWLLPCRSNGNIVRFEIKCHLRDSDEVSFLYEVPVIDNREEYSFSTEDFLPDSYYKITVVAVTENHTGEESSRQIDIEAGGSILILRQNRRRVIYTLNVS